MPPRHTSATTTTASVLAPRLMVKSPSIGQRSILASNVGALSEVILISCYYERAACPQRPIMYGWFGCVFYKFIRALLGFPVLHQQEKRRGSWNRERRPDIGAYRKRQRSCAVRGWPMDRALCPRTRANRVGCRTAHRKPAEYLYRCVAGLQARHVRGLADRASPPQPDPGWRRGQDRRPLGRLFQPRRRGAPGEGDPTGRCDHGDHYRH